MFKVRISIIGLVCIFSVLMIGCEEKTSEKEGNQSQKTIKEENEIQNDQKLLTIVGNNINLRDQPSLEGKPVGQAQDGEVYEVFSSSLDFETIGRETDFWYQIEKQGELVWIFGAFTNEDLNNNPQVFRAIYNGVEWGDYFHLIFAAQEAKKGSYEMIDFGDAADENNYGDFKLEEEEENYKGKVFDVTWKVKPLVVYKGEGSMETEIREVPVIVDLNLVE